jgi:hypothetical protein
MRIGQPGVIAMFYGLKRNGVKRYTPLNLKSEIDGLS